MKKKSNKFLILMCVLMMALPFFTFNASAGDNVIEDFDSYAEGVSSGSNDYVSWYVYVGETDTTKYKSSPMSLHHKADDDEHHPAYINLIDDTDISGFEFSFLFDNGYFISDDYALVSLKNSTNSDIVRFKLPRSPDAGIQIYDYDTYSTLLSSAGVDTDTWYCVGFQSNHSVGNPSNYVYYYVKDSDGEIIADLEKRWCSLNEYDDESLGQIKIDYYNPNEIKLDIWLDDFTILDYTPPPPPEYEGEFDFESSDKIGSIDTACFNDLGAYKEFEFKYHIPMTINATGFDLLVSTDQYIHADVLGHYDLFINGESLGHPTEWKKYGNFYVLRWEFITPLVIEDSEILFELWHDVLAIGNYWRVGVGCNRNDMDQDAWSLMKTSNTYPNGAFDGNVFVHDVAYQLYYDDFSFVEEVIDVTHNSISTTGESFYVGDSIPLTYTIKTSDLIYDNHVRIWNNDTSIEITIDTMQGFPYLCPYQLETIGFVPFTSANYTAHLYINDVDVTNVSFFVNDHINPDMYVFTYPNPSKTGQKIRVQYNYDHPSSKDGAIFLCSSPNLNSYISVNHLSDGDSGFWSETHNTAGTYYYIMAVDITGNGTYGIVNEGIHPHSVVNEQGNNYFKLGGYNLRLNTEGIVTQIVKGESNLLSGNCFIYDNNKLIRTITESPFSYSYDIYTAGLHTVEMRLVTNVTTVLFWENYSVSTFTGEDEVEQIEDTSYILHDWVYDMYGNIGVFVAGICVVLGCMFIPFALVIGVNVKFNKNIALGDLHWSTYLIFAIVGVIIDVQLHLAELWIILLICVISIAIAVITYKGYR